MALDDEFQQELRDVLQVSLLIYAQLKLIRLHAQQVSLVRHEHELPTRASLPELEVEHDELLVQHVLVLYELVQSAFPLLSQLDERGQLAFIHRHEDDGLLIVLRVPQQRVRAVGPRHLRY